MDEIDYRKLTTSDSRTETAAGFSQRRGGAESDVPGAAQPDAKVGPLDPLEGGAELFHLAVGRPHPRGQWSVADFLRPG